MKNIAVLITGLTVSNVRRTMDGMRKCSEETGCNLFVFNCERRYLPGNRHDEGEYSLFDLPDFSQFDGAVVMSSTIFCGRTLADILTRIDKAGIPAVSLEKIRPGMMNVYIDNQSAMSQIVEHMIVVHHCRRINYISGPADNQEAQDRLEAYRAVLSRHGIPYEPERVFMGDYMKASGEAAAEAFLRSSLPFPEAIVAGNDAMALAAYHVLTRNGKRIPEDVLLSGFDDEFEAQYMIPGLTSVARMQEEAGYTACNLVLSGMGDEDRGKRVIIATKGVFRESCGCVSQDGISEERFRKLYFAQEEINNRFIADTQHLAIDLTSVDTFSQLKIAMKRFIPNIGCDGFFLFLYETVMEKQELDLFRRETEPEEFKQMGGERPAVLFFGYYKGSFLEEQQANLNDVLHSAFNPQVKGNCFVLSPIHFGDRKYGYCLIENCELPFSTNLYYNWIMSLGNAVESIRKRQLMKLMISELDNMWSYDALTGLYNRSGFLKYGGRVWAESVRNGTNVLLLFMDMDGLKNINDTYGHDEGDRCIRQLGEILKKLRRHGEAVTRYGGDEFLMIAANATLEYAKQYLSNLEAGIEAFNQTSSLPYRLSASVGYHFLCPSASDELSDAIDMADQNMYLMKKEKKQHRLSVEYENQSAGKE